MAKKIRIKYSITASFMKMIDVDEDFEINYENSLTKTFEELVFRFPNQSIDELDNTCCNCSPEYIGQDPFELYSLEIINND
jgi:hypothetical protein